MSNNHPAYKRYEDETGEAYYCPIDAVSDNRVVSDREVDDCVEASTVRRYAGHLDITERNAS